MLISHTLHVVAAALGAVSLTHALPAPAGISDVAHAASTKAIENAAAGFDDLAKEVSATLDSNRLAETSRSPVVFDFAQAPQRLGRGRPKGSFTRPLEERPAAARAKVLRRADTKKRKRRVDTGWHERELISHRLRRLRIRLGQEPTFSEKMEYLWSFEPKEMQPFDSGDSHVQRTERLAELQRNLHIVEQRRTNASPSNHVTQAADPLTRAEMSRESPTYMGAEQERHMPDLNADVKLFDLNAPPSSPATSLTYAVPVHASISDLVNLAGKDVDNIGATFEAAQKASETLGSSRVSDTASSLLELHRTAASAQSPQRKRGRPKGSFTIPIEERPAAKRAKRQRAAAEKRRRRRSSATKDVEWHLKEMRSDRSRRLRKKLAGQAKRTEQAEPALGTADTETHSSQSGLPVAADPTPNVSATAGSEPTVRDLNVALFDLNAPPATP